LQSCASLAGKTQSYIESILTSRFFNAS
jgi:hypothetical protein